MQKRNIRKAKPTEAQHIAPLLLLAMEDIVFDFIGQNSEAKALQLLTLLIQEKGNQYSYENCWVVEEGEAIIAATVVYDGALLIELRKPVLRKIETLFGRSIQPERETRAGEYYIDCIGVKPDQQGKGVGSDIFRFLMQEYTVKMGKILGLLVDEDNPSAKHLYLRLGFKIVGKQKLAGKYLEHLQYKN